MKVINLDQWHELTSNDELDGWYLREKRNESFIRPIDFHLWGLLDKVAAQSSELNAMSENLRECVYSSEGTRDDTIRDVARRLKEMSK